MARNERRRMQQGARGSRSKPTPILITPRARTILALLAVVALVLLVRAAPSVPVILVGGATLALILSFPVRLLSHVMPRGLAILLTFLIALGAIALALFALVPVLVEQLTALVAATPQIAEDTNAYVIDLLRPLQERGWITERPEDLLARLGEELTARAQTFAQTALTTLLGFLTGVLNILFQSFGVLFVAVYLLIDIRKFEAAYLRAVPSRYRRDALQLWDAFGQSLSRYLGGLVVSLLIQGVLAAIFLTVLGVPYPVVLGAWTSVTALLPYIGAFLGAIPALIIALFISPVTALLTALAYLVINQIEGNFLTPRIQGQALKVHPILIFLAVVAGSEIAGLAGAIFAVPALAVLRVLFEFFRARLRVQRPAPPVLLTMPAPAPPPTATTARYTIRPRPDPQPRDQEPG